MRIANTQISGVIISIHGRHRDFMDMFGIACSVRHDSDRRNQALIILKQARSRSTFDRVAASLTWRECQGWTQVLYDDEPNYPDAS
jgi:hypothetical protein